MFWSYTNLLGIVPRVKVLACMLLFLFVFFLQFITVKTIYLLLLLGHVAENKMSVLVSHLIINIDSHQQNICIFQ